MSRHADLRGPLRTVARSCKTREEAANRLGHLYDELVEAGLVREGEREAYIKGRFRCLRTPIAITAEGLSLINGETR